MLNFIYGCSYFLFVVVVIIGPKTDRRNFMLGAHALGNYEISDETRKCLFIEQHLIYTLIIKCRDTTHIHSAKNYSTLLNH